MGDNSVISLQIHSYTLIASLTQDILRIMLQVHHNDEYLYISQKYSQEYFPQELQIMFENVGGFYQYLYKVAVKKMTDRISFKNGLLIIKVFIDDKIRQIPIKMRKMREEKQNYLHSDNQFMLTSIISQPSQSESRATSKAEQGSFPAARLKLMMLKDNSRMKKAMTKIPQYSSSSVTQAIKQYPYVKPQTIGRYDNKLKTQNAIYNSRQSYSQGKTQFNRSHNNSRSFSLKKNIRQNNMDLSNKDLKWQDVKEIISYDWSKLILMNLGYNNIGTEGLKIVTTVKWPSLKTLYVCFNNISKIEWTPANICFLKTLSLSGNKIRQIPKNITELQFLQQFFIYNNKIQILPQQLTVMQELKNFSIYGNKLDMIKNKKVIAKLKARKVQVWE